MQLWPNWSWNNGAITPAKDSPEFSAVWAYTPDLENRQMGFQSLTENIDTTSPTGKLIFHLFGSLAEFERGLIWERVNAGLAAAKSQGQKFGRPEALGEKDKAMALAMFNGGATKIAIARHFKVTRQTIYSLLKDYDT